MPVSTISCSPAAASACNSCNTAASGLLRTGPRASVTAQNAQRKLQPSCTFTVARVRSTEAVNPGAKASPPACPALGGRSCRSSAGRRACSAIGTTRSTPSIRAGPLRRERGITPGDHQQRRLIDFQRAAQRLARFGVGFTGDRTGIDNIDVRGRPRGHDDIPAGNQRARQRIAVIPVGFAPQRGERDGDRCCVCVRHDVRVYRVALAVNKRVSRAR